MMVGATLRALAAKIGRSVLGLCLDSEATLAEVEVETKSQSKPRKQNPAYCTHTATLTPVATGCLRRRPKDL
jgi:hypothetical protein